VRSASFVRLATSIALAACATPTASDAGSADATASIDAGDADGSPDAPVACWAAVDAVLARCSATVSPNHRRLCTLRAYRDACASGRSDVIASIAGCLVSADPCATARSPGSAASCVAGVVAGRADATQRALDHAWCVCSPAELGCPDAPALTGPELALLDDADAQSTTACLTAGCTMPTFCFGSTALGAALLQCDMVMP
jgi:hypothetical protein